MPPPSSSSRSHRDSRQHFHKGRQGSLLLPHGPNSGLLFSVNPRAEGHALREAREYCLSLTEDLQRATADAAAATQVTPDTDRAQDATEDQSAHAPTAISTSDLLAAELAAYTTTTTSTRTGSACAHDRKRRRDASDDGSSSGSEDDEDTNDTNETSRRQVRPSKRQQWFAPLETTCKGYLLLNVPVVNPLATCVVCHAGTGSSEKSTEADAVVATEPSDAVANTTAATTTTTTTTSTTVGGSSDSTAILPPHSIVINPLVSIVVERVFHDLMSIPRPVFKNCFRLFPVELTCCPTMAEMHKAVQTLLRARFPRPEDTPAVMASSAPPAAETQSPAFSQRLPFYEPTAACEDAGSGATLVKSMYKITLQFSVKNNTNVEKKKAEVLSMLQSAIPANRFILLRGSSASGKNKIKADASLVVAVLQATCVMGVQMHYEDRQEYNVHAMGAQALELSNAVTPS